MAANSTSKGTFQPDSDVHITYEDQQKINRFAKLNAKLEDYKEEIKTKENDLKSLEEACDEIALFDDDEQIPYLFGEVFIYQDSEKTQECLTDAMEKTQNEIQTVQDKINQVKATMVELKNYLYGKFGNHINLEADEE